MAANGDAGEIVMPEAAWQQFPDRQRYSDKWVNCCVAGQ